MCVELAYRVLLLTGDLLLNAGTLAYRVLVGTVETSSPATMKLAQCRNRVLPTRRSRGCVAIGKAHIVASVNIKPLEDKIVVQALEAETTTASGLVIPDTAKEKPQEGTVIAVGPGRVNDQGTRIPVDVAEGDVVIYSKYGGTEVKYAGQDYLILSARDVLAVVTK